jgi:hypothetical protein
MKKKKYNYNYNAYKDTGKPIRLRSSCAYWEVPAYPSCLELLQHLIRDTAIAKANAIAQRELIELRMGKLKKTLNEKRIKRLNDSDNDDDEDSLYELDELI